MDVIEESLKLAYDQENAQRYLAVAERLKQLLETVFQKISSYLLLVRSSVKCCLLNPRHLFSIMRMSWKIGRVWRRLQSISSTAFGSTVQRAQEHDQSRFQSRTSTWRFQSRLLRVMLRSSYKYEHQNRTRLCQCHIKQEHSFSDVPLTCKKGFFSTGPMMEIQQLALPPQSIKQNGWATRTVRHLSTCILQ